MMMMSSINLGRVWMATSVAVVQGHNHDQEYCFQWNTGLIKSSLDKLSKKSSSSYVDTLAAAGLLGSDFDDESNFHGRTTTHHVIDGSCSKKRKQADESLQKVMYVSCWGQS
ncbi:Protein of unknown function wound-induced [Macleaya cordata]|uniref:Uncharacterized protein n=1 Tax=Macleaya cordata TaxID=56857 RepID=A0A200QC12_MACCD|nr:Protein of unknown function wound-induced [Macleaya cordata]